MAVTLEYVLGGVSLLRVTKSFKMVTCSSAKLTVTHLLIFKTHFSLRQCLSIFILLQNSHADSKIPTFDIMYMNCIVFDVNMNGRFTAR